MSGGPDRSALGVLILGLAGVVVAGYLTVAHYGITSLACQASSLVDCEAVTTSSYSFVPGTAIPVSVPGLIWSVITVGAGLALLRRPPGDGARRVEIGLLVWAGAALLAVFYFVRAEIVVIGRLCLWCTVFHVIVLAVLLLSIARLQGDTRAES